VEAQNNAAANTGEPERSDPKASSRSPGGGKKSRATWLLVGTALLLSTLAGAYRLRSFDTFWHVAAGRHILDAGAVPSTDPFSFTFRGAHWSDHSPLFQVFLAVVDGLGGPTGLSLLQLAAAAVLSAIALLASARAGASLAAASVLALIPLFSFREVLSPRPHLAGFVLLAVSLHVMLSVERQAGRNRGAKRLLWLPLVYLPWLLSHGSHLLLPAILVLALILDLLRRRRRLALHRLAALAGCLLLILVFTPEALTLGFGHLGSEFLAREVPEWLPVTAADIFGTWPGRGLLAVAILSLAGLALNAVKDGGGKQKGVLDGLPTVGAPLLAWFLLPGFLVLAVSARRMTPLFLMGAAPLWLPYAAWSLESLATAVRSAVLAGAGQTHARLAGAVLAVAGMLAIALPGLSSDGPFEAGIGMARERVPEQAVSAMQQAGLEPRLYHAYNWGGYLLYRGYPKAGVFVDGRAITLYPPAFLKDFHAAYEDPRLFEVLAARFEVDAVLMPTRSRRTGKLIAYLDREPAWRLFYKDAMAVVFVGGARGVRSQP
jgi:hypothetical protein